jgi:fluoride exporter
MTHYLLVFLGAGVGGVLRYGVSLAYAKNATEFPWPTLGVNLVGCLLMGFAAAFLNTPDRESWRLFLLVGVLGGFTTFSSFSLETLNLWNNNYPITAITYVLVSNVLGVSLAGAGYITAAWSLK